MIIAVGVVCVALVVAAVFVTALSTSYVHLEDRVNRLTESTGSPVAVQFSAKPGGVPTGVGGEAGRAAHDLAGMTLDGGARNVSVIGVGHFTLLAFLSSGCKSCGRFWEVLRHDRLPEMGSDTRVVVVTKGPDSESPTELERLARDVEFIMSSEAWSDFEVPGSPFFILVDGPKGAVAGEGTALGWDEVRNLVALGRGDASILTGVDTSAMKPASDAEREAIVDQVLMDAGIFPGDPSLYPSQIDLPPEDPV
jgi:hypothetical protein